MQRGRKVSQVRLNKIRGKIMSNPYFLDFHNVPERMAMSVASRQKPCI
ncbi:MAG: hypothetical protein OXC40_02820 [Proteobacteria bacterium]|nr:hypothetical protein [Pseudomonadota bacterium]